MSETVVAQPTRAASPWMSRLNTTWHRRAMYAFLAVTLAHWAEHLVQAAQIWLLGWSRPEAKGVLGLAFPWLVTSEWLHYGYAIVMLVLLVLLRPAMAGPARIFWDAALVIQAWHHFEHFLLLAQAVTHTNLFGQPVPTSIVQYFMPGMRVELHLFYNAVVFVPMLIGMLWHVWAKPKPGEAVTCSCNRHARKMAA